MHRGGADITELAGLVTPPSPLLLVGGEREERDRGREEDEEEDRRARRSNKSFHAQFVSQFMVDRRK